MNIIQLGILVFVAFIHLTNASTRIVGGQNGVISNFPFLAQLRRRVGATANFQYHCTGALVNPTHLVTAAHCFDGLYNDQPSQWQIRVGATNQLGTEDQAYVFVPNNISIHEDYNSANFDKDIAVVGWQFPLWPSSIVDFMPLNNISLQSDNTTLPAFSQVTVAGWGGINLAGAISNILQFAIIPTIELNVCRANYAWHSRIITENMICAGATGRGSCTNDRGLPLIYLNPATNVRFLAGVSSWRIGCGTANQPGVFAVVHATDEWLDKTSRGE